MTEGDVLNPHGCGWSITLVSMWPLTVKDFIPIGRQIIQFKSRFLTLQWSGIPRWSYMIVSLNIPAQHGQVFCVAFVKPDSKGFYPLLIWNWITKNWDKNFPCHFFFTGAFMAFHAILIPVRPLFQTGHFEEGPNWFMKWVMKTVKHLLWYIFFYLHFHKFSLNSILVHVVNTLTGHFIRYTDMRLSKRWQNFHFLGKLCL